VRQEVGNVLDNERAPDGDYYSRNPVASIVQSALDEHLEHKRERARTTRAKTARDRDEADRIEHDDERMGDPFTKWDIAGWVGDVALSLIHRVIEGSHPFCHSAARASLPAQARLVLLSDWGTGREGAKMVGAKAQPFLYESPVEAHLVHLGDTYYSGTKREGQHNIIDIWPVGPGSSMQIGSWALNGNHDMYSGGDGLFETILADQRFSRQRVNGAATTWFHLQSDDWNVVGLDTAWKQHLLQIHDGGLYGAGALGALEGGEQLDLLRLCAADDARRLLVLSHHQLFSANDADHALFAADPDATTPLAEQVRPVLGGRTIDAWFWGHEHDCVAFDPFGGVGAARAVGHGAVPELAATSPSTPIGGGAPPFVVKPVTGPGDPPVRRAVRWQYRDYRVGQDNRRWAKHGLAVLDLDGRDLNVRYVDDEGDVWLTETI
jgi:hypothetical protein